MDLSGFAVCEYCGQNMGTKLGCTFSHLILSTKSGKDVYVKRRKATSNGCDCGVYIVKGIHLYHHHGCDCERCPVCKGQLISCGCDVKGVAK